MDEQPARWVGPLPPPSALREFDLVVNDGAERLFREFEAEAEHRRSLERQVVEAEAGQKAAAQWLAGSSSFAALAVSVYALTIDAHTAAAIIGGGSIGMVVAAFLGRKLQGRRD